MVSLGGKRIFLNFIKSEIEFFILLILFSSSFLTESLISWSDITDKYTFAWDKSGLISTSVTETNTLKSKYSLIISDFDGFNSKAILNTTQPIISPTWSPDGKKIAYVSFEKKKPVIYVQNLKTGKRTLLANFKGNNSAPAWSPDSKKLAIVLTYNKNSVV